MGGRGNLKPGRAVLEKGACSCCGLFPYSTGRPMSSFDRWHIPPVTLVVLSRPNVGDAAGATQSNLP